MRSDTKVWCRGSVVLNWRKTPEPKRRLDGPYVPFMGWVPRGTPPSRTVSRSHDVMTKQTTVRLPDDLTSVGQAATGGVPTSEYRAAVTNLRFSASTWSSTR